MNWLTLVLLAIFFASVAMLIREGLWSNAITLFNVITAALLATNLWEPAARWLETSVDKTYRYLWDFLAIWGIFCIAMIVLRTATDFLSRTAVRFKKPVHIAGGAICAIWVGWVLVCFTTMTLHMAPLAPDFMGGRFQPTPESRMFFGLAPDRRWLAFVQKVSRGSLAVSQAEGEGEPSPRKEDAGLRVFDPVASFIFKYHQRRVNLDEHLGKTGALRVR